MKTLITSALAATAIIVGGASLSVLGSADTAHAQAANSKSIVDAAKDRGEIGERFNGYLGVVGGSVSPDVKAAMDDINVSRQALYIKLAREKGQSELQVGKVFALQQFEKAEVGHFLQWEDGSWRQK